MGANGACGPTLFRFLSSHRDGTTMLQGHGRWGNETTNIQINVYDGETATAPKVIELYVGDGHDFGGRSENMPKFHGNYRRLGAARCQAR